MSEFGTEQILLIVFIGLAIGWLASIMTGKGFLKHMIWCLIGAAIGAVMLPRAGVVFNLGNPMADFAAFTALGATFCALVAQVLN